MNHGWFRKGQSSFEFMLVLTFAFVMVIPLVILMFNESGNASEQVSLAQAGQVVRRIAGSAEAVYAYGAPTRIIVEAYFPDGLNSSFVSGNSIGIVVNSKGELTTVSDSVSMNVSGSFGVWEGIHKINVEAANNTVLVSESLG
jgi:hypothetical protein